MESGQNNLMMRIASFIVNKRNLFLLFFILASIYSVCMMSKVEVINELTEYLPETTETRQGVDIMDEEFTTFGTAKILIPNITYERALSLAEELEEIKGISSVKFYDREDEEYDDEELSDYYRDASALFTLNFDEEEDTDLSQKAIAQARECVSKYENYVYTTVDRDEARDLRNDMKIILVIVVMIIILVLLFTSSTYVEIPIFLLVFMVAALLNMGTNYWFGTISFVTNAVGTVLQLGLSIDYAIILLKRFIEERQKLDTKEAITVALSKAIPEIASSSLTTVSGMLALMLMQYRIGMDMGRVLTKAIILSLITVFFFMPALIVRWSAMLEKTAHRSFVPDISGWGRMVVRTRHVVLPLFVVLMVGGCYCSNQCHYIYDINSVDSMTRNEFLAAKDRIEETFEVTNAMAVVLPLGDYQKEAAVIKEMEQMDFIGEIVGLSNIEVDDDGRYVLVDKLNPREFAEVADIDLSMVQMLYQFYAIDQKQYSAFMKNLDEYRIPIIDMIDFMYDQKEKGGLNLDDDLSEDIDDLYDAVCDARAQLEGENYSRIVFELKGPVEGAETFAAIDQVRTAASRYYDNVLVVGDATSNYDLSNSFQKDNILISVMTALFVGIILLFTFRSFSVPVMLLVTIQSSIWINFSFPYLSGSTMFFLSYLIVSAIQMGATIDYAIVITSRYLELRKSIPDRRQVVVLSLNHAFPTVATSGTILTCAGFVVGMLTGNPVIASLGTVLGRGALCSIILVMTVLPQILLIFDSWIDRMAFDKDHSAKEVCENETNA
ncbi:MAG: RND family transporter [Brotaphodocola sp.]